MDWRLFRFRSHWKWPLLIAYLLGLKYLKGREYNFRDNGELILCCMLTIDVGTEVGIAQFKCKLRSNIQQYYPNHSMKFGRGVSPNFQHRQVSPRLWYWLTYLLFIKMTIYHFRDTNPWKWRSVTFTKNTNMNRKSFLMYIPFSNITHLRFSKFQHYISIIIF